MFLNTISHSLDLMKQGGIDAGMHRQETDEALILTINIKTTLLRILMGLENPLLA